MEIIPIIVNSTVISGGSRNPSKGVATGTVVLRSIRDRGSLMRSYSGIWVTRYSGGAV
jgi:hypothetical protein